MEKVQYIIGADLSKKSIDLACHQPRVQVRIENNSFGFKELIQWMKQQKIDPAKAMIVMEHTGLYSYGFEDFLLSRHLVFTKVPALAIKRSLGIIRGKTDRIDARRIANYGQEKQESLIPYSQAGKELRRLQMLHSTRDRLVRQRAGLLNAIEEYRNIGLKDKDLLVQSQLQVISCLDRQIKKIEKESGELIDQDPALSENIRLLKSIKGVGKVLALATVIKTQNFTRFENARKFACFCGTAPFEHQSGTSIMGRTRVSHLADKSMKTLLDLAAKTAIQHDKELKDFYLRRLEMGKPKMSTINIVRNKILYRMFAVVKRQTPFTDNHLQAA